MKDDNSVNMAKTELKTLREVGGMKETKPKNQIKGLKSFMNKLNS
jgi:hypothetical protein